MAALASIALFAATAAIAGPVSNTTTYSAAHANGTSIDKRRDCFCEYPGDHGMREYSIIPDAETHPWAMPDSEWDSCKCGMWCQYNCQQGFMPGQWDENANLSPAEKRAHGGLYCSHKNGGTLEPPRRGGKKNKPLPYCLDQRNEHVLIMKTSLDFNRDQWLCQTKLPGSELPLQGLAIGSPAAIALPIPDDDTFKDPETGKIAPAHFYINNPDVKLEDACTLGDINAPNGRGIYAPYVLEVNPDPEVNRVNVTISWNPIFLKEGWPKHWQRPSFGIRGTCFAHDGKGDNCQNTQCRIEPGARWDAEVGYNIVKGAEGTVLSKDDKGLAYCTSSIGFGGHMVLETFAIEG